MEDYYISTCNNCGFNVIFFKKFVNFDNKKIFCSKTCCSSFIIKNDYLKLKSNHCVIKNHTYF